MLHIDRTISVRNLLLMRDIVGYVLFDINILIFPAVKNKFLYLSVAFCHGRLYYNP